MEFTRQQVILKVCIFSSFATVEYSDLAGQGLLLQVQEYARAASHFIHRRSAR